MYSLSVQQRVARMSRCARTTFALLLVQAALLGSAIGQDNYGNGTQFYTTANPVQVGQPVDLVATAPAGLTAENRFDFYGDTEDFFTVEPLCTNVTGRTIGTRWIAHCVVTFPNAGTRYLYAGVGTPGGNIGQVAGTDVVQNVVAAAPFDANQFALTGSWYNPAASAQGLMLEVFPDLTSIGGGYLFGGWMAYDADGNSQWDTLQGSLSDSGASYALGIYVTTGGHFGGATPTTTVADGAATLTFYDCTHAALSYSFADGRAGTLPYIRLTDSMGCSTAVPASAPMPLPANENDALHSGAWADPAIPGQGLVVDIVPTQTTFFAAWYTYAPVSAGLTGVAAQRWLTLQSNDYTPGNLTLDDVPIYATTGGVFNGLSEVATEQVGTADIAFTSCTTMTLHYTFTAGEFSGLSGTSNERTIAPVSDCQ